MNIISNTEYITLKTVCYQILIDKAFCEAFKLHKTTIIAILIMLYSCQMADIIADNNDKLIHRICCSYDVILICIFVLFRVFKYAMVPYYYSTIDNSMDDEISINTSSIQFLLWNYSMDKWYNSSKIKRNNIGQTLAMCFFFFSFFVWPENHITTVLVLCEIYYRILFVTEF